MLNRSRGAPLAAAGVLCLLASVASARPLPGAAATALVVTTAADPVAGTACPAMMTMPCSLRTAVADANLLGGSGVATITFSVGGPFVLGQGELLVNGGETLTIQGSSDGSIVIDGADTDRVILVESSTTVSLDHVTLTNGDIGLTGNGRDGYGGAIDINTGSTVTLTDSAVTNSTAINGGGGVDDNTTSKLTLIRTTISGNTAGVEGGGIDTNTGAVLTAINSTLTGNAAGPPGGGALDAITGTTVALVNDTIAGNTASGANIGGVVAASATTTITNSIVSGNANANCAGVVTDGGHNLENGTSCGFAAAAVHADPLLGPLQGNGGPTNTMALGPGSLAIAAADNAVCGAATSATPPGAGAVDQRGATRPQGAQCDIGAFEVIATSVSLSAPSTATAGQAITLTATVTAKQEIPGKPTGSLVFIDGAVALGTASVDPGTATLTTSALTPGTHTLTAKFAQTPLFLGSVSPAVTVQVSIPVPTVGAAADIALPRVAALTLGGLISVVFALVLRRRRRR